VSESESVLKQQERNVDPILRPTFTLSSTYILYLHIQRTICFWKEHSFSCYSVSASQSDLGRFFHLEYI